MQMPTHFIVYYIQMGIFSRFSNLTFFSGLISCNLHFRLISTAVSFQWLPCLYEIQIISDSSKKRRSWKPKPPLTIFVHEKLSAQQRFFSFLPLGRWDVDLSWGMISVLYYRIISSSIRCQRAKLSSFGFGRLRFHALQHRSGFPAVRSTRG